MFKTVAYADIFDYPLTAEEVDRWWIPTGSDPAGKNSPIGSDPIVKTNGYYHLPGRANLVKLRRRRQHFSQLKWPTAYRAAKILSFIPWVKLVCVTGALAMSNSDKDDDIDLMIVTAKNRLWLTRLVALLLLLSRLRRGNQINNRLCLNLWLDEISLAIKRRDLYTAHELCQARPIFNRDQTYQKFIAANLWYNQFLPNALQGCSLTGDPAESRVGTAKPEGASLMDKLESFFFRLQYWYMKPKLTRERVGRHFAFFHPRPTGKIVMDEFNRRLKHLRGERSSHLGGVILATGVFDVLHSEHKKFLKAAKNLDGVLLVGVETDVRVRQLKGPGRPVNLLAVRLANLRRLRIPDQVFSLPEKFASERDHTALIKKLRPDILAVSASTPNLDSKRRIMKKFGGKVIVILPHNPKISTSKVLESNL